MSAWAEGGSDPTRTWTKGSQVGSSLKNWIVELWT
jgi:hypothetical protein